MAYKDAEIGIKYLTENLGYDTKDIQINSGGGIPDLTTLSDGKEWEVKKIGSNYSRVNFTQPQREDFNNDVNVLIFRRLGRHGHTEFLGCIKFGDILCSEKLLRYTCSLDGTWYDYRFLVTYEVDIQISDKVCKAIDDDIDGRLFLLTGAPGEDVHDYLWSHSEGHIRMLLQNAKNGYDVRELEDDLRHRGMWNIHIKDMLEKVWIGDLDEIIECHTCHKKLKNGDSYCIGNRYGFKISVCKDCYVQ